MILCYSATGFSRDWTPKLREASRLDEYGVASDTVGGRSLGIRDHKKITFFLER